MKDGLEPLASASAAYMNQLELGHLSDVGEVAQQILSVSSKLVELPLKLAFPDLAAGVASQINRLAGVLVEKATKSEALNVETFAYCVIADLQRLGKDLEALVRSDREAKFLVEGGRRARDASSLEKVLRLSQVVVSGVLASEDPNEKVSEFIRFAAELNETDIHVLSVMYTLQHQFNSKEVPTWASEVRRVMHDREITDKDGNVMDDQYVRSAYARLQALGLVVQFGGTASDTSPGEQHYAILTLGKEFYQYLRHKGE
jgi:hypothetical protein